MKALVAHQKMKEFDPKCERHYPLLIVKAVDPGCTIEVQIENCMTGEVTRLTTGEEHDYDMALFEAAIIKAFRLAFQEPLRSGGES